MKNKQKTSLKDTNLKFCIFYFYLRHEICIYRKLILTSIYLILSFCMIHFILNFYLFITMHTIHKLFLVIFIYQYFYNTCSKLFIIKKST